jgi:hypothetical protein
MLLSVFALRMVREPDSQWNPQLQKKQLDKAFPRGCRTSMRQNPLALKQLEVFVHLVSALESKLQAAGFALDTLRG